MEDHRRPRQREVAKNGAPLAFRPATGADRTFIRSLTRNAFAAYGDYDAIMDGWLSDPRTRTVIAELDGRAAGFAMWAVPSDSPMEVVLVSLALVPEARGHGHGRALLDEVHRAIAAEAPGLAREVALDVAEDNAPARTLFTQTGYREDFGPTETYPSGQRALRMRLWLSISPSAP